MLLQAVLNPDLIAPNALNISSSHTTYNTTYKDNITYKEEEFDASDEEPLHHKKTKRKRRREGGTGRRKRTKKEEDRK